MSGLILFLLGAFSLLEVQLIGRLFIVEVLFACIFVWALFTKEARKKFPRLIRIALPLIIIWLFVQVATDFYRDTPFEDYARGWAKISFFGADVVAICILSGNRLGNIILFIAGFCLSQIVVAAFYSSNLMIWKFGFGAPLTTLSVIAAAYARRRFSKFLILTILIVSNLLFDFRSLAGFCLVGALAASYGELQTSAAYALSKLRRHVVWLALGALFSFFFVQLYLVSEKLGYGSYVGQYERSGVDRNPLYGRLEFVIGLQAALDSPIIGHGSWAKDFQYAYLLNLMVRDIRGDAGPIGDELIPAHSYLVGAWVEAGIVGALFWLFVLFRSVRAFKNAARWNLPQLAFISFFLANFIWAILFSPFGAEVRIFAATAIVLVSYIESCNSLKGTQKVNRDIL
jgi:hypothetical protein